MNIAASSDGGSAALGLVIWVVLIVAYWSPTITGALTRKHNLGVIAVWNFFGFFFLFPFIMAWVKVAEKPQPPAVVYTGFQPPKVYPPYPPQSAPYSGQYPPQPPYDAPSPQGKQPPPEGFR